MKEKWLPIDGFAGYEVSSKGRVRSLDRLDRFNRPLKGVVLKQYTHRDGYQKITLTINSQKKNFQVHRLVALHFLKNKNAEKNEVNHKNGVKTDNKIKNLEWVSRSENMKHRWEELRIPSYRKLTEEKVKQIKKRLKKGESQRKIASSYGVTQECIGLINRGKCWSWV